ncbi:MAG: CpsD/CapB family tyrosine-protein kinase [Clostridia bacterium]|nr:CpsD/CapB family tyrosine-protein kinase [Clostridia bacterium]
MNTINLISKMPERYEMREAFKTFRTNVQFSGSDIKVISITSSTQNEGKSFVSLELAKSLAETGKKVLLVDADLRKSALADRYVDEKDMLGLSHYLSGQSNSDEIVYATQFEALYVVFSGPYPPNPVELLGSKKFDEMIEYYRSIFDYIIIDTPPLGLVIDAAVVSTKCDGVIINVAANQTSYRSAQFVKKQLERAGCNILGAVLNMAEPENLGYKSSLFYNYYYRRKYNYYYSEDKEQKNFAALNIDNKE